MTLTISYLIIVVVAYISHLPFTVAVSPLGPGSGNWKLSDPSDVGLSAAKLKQAAFSVGKQGTPFCLAVAKVPSPPLSRKMMMFFCVVVQVVVSPSFQFGFLKYQHMYMYTHI